MNKSGRKRAVIWNAHWLTLGGGERYALSIVHSLIELDFEVLVLGNCDDPSLLLLNKFGENLKDSRYMRVQDERSVYELAQNSDIFINASYGSTLPAPIVNSFYVCHFPETSRVNKFKKRIFLQNENQAFGSLGERIFPDRKSKLIVTSKVHLINSKKPSLTIQNSGANIEIEDNTKSSPYSLDRNEKIELALNSKVTILRNEHGGVLVENLDPPKLKTLIRHHLYNPDKFYLTYKVIFANSGFTASWILRNWGIESSILFPPVVIGYGEPHVFLARNDNKILSVGRFIDPKNGHSKNQLELIRAFKILSRKFDRRYELHLAGGLDTRNQEYFAKVEKLARNEKIFLYPNISGKDLDSLYKTSRFFWHAAGMCVPKNQPEKMEHFGISVVEAIGNSLIPIVYDSAGPAEILHDFPELRFKDYASLVRNTISAQDLSAEKLNLLSQIPSRYDRKVFSSEFRRFINT
jgi:hypothetical protein